MNEPKNDIWTQPKNIELINSHGDLFFEKFFFF